MKELNTEPVARKDNQVRILIPDGFKTRLFAMYEDLNTTVSEDTRDYWERKLAKYEAKK